MKIVSRFVYVLASAALCLGLSNANAQEIQAMSVRFPFAITVGARTLPPGNYTISTLDVTSDAPIFMVRGLGGSAVTFASNRVATAPHALTKDDVVVDVSGDKHILSKVRLQESGSIYELVRPTIK